MTERQSFQPPEILLLGPGPSPVSMRVRTAQAAPVLGHLDPEFLALMDRVQADLRMLFGTENRLTLPISATGSAGMETCLANLVHPGDRVVIGVHGVFGQRMCEHAGRLGADVVRVESEFGAPLSIGEMTAAIAAGPTKVVAFVHAETSTGVLQPVPEIAAAARQVGALCVLDCVTSLAGAPVAVDEWGIDAAFSGTQKCLSVPPGLSPVTFSDAALARAGDRKPPTWYFDLQLLGGYWGGDRVYHHTAPVSSIYGLASGLDQVVEEGLEARFARHRAAAAALYRGLAEMGLECLVEARYRTPMLTSVTVPDGVDEVAVRRFLRDQHRIEIGGGLGPLAGKVWRIGLMGHGARQSSVLRVLTALGDALSRTGHRRDVAGALSAARGIEP